MKLAEALVTRAELQKKILQLADRLNTNAKVQEGDVPAEDPLQLMDQLSEANDQLEKLVTRINLTNCQTSTLLEGETLTSLISKRDALSRKLNIMRDFLRNASAKVDRYSKNEIRVNSTVNVAELQKSIDADAKELRTVTLKIQELNWTTDLL